MGGRGRTGEAPLPGFGERLLQGARWAPLPRPPVPQQGAQASRRCRAQGRFAVTCLPSRGLLFAVVSLCEAPARAMPRPDLAEHVPAAPRPPRLLALRLPASDSVSLPSSSYREDRGLMEPISISP